MKRQGDLLLKSIVEFPETRLVKLWIENNETILLHGEATGHNHKLKGDFDLYRDESNNIYLDINKTCQLVHDEHHTLEIEAGKYAFVRQREYTPKAIVYVRD